MRPGRVTGGSLGHHHFKGLETMTTDLFNSNPRALALQLVADGVVSADHLLMCAIQYMTADAVRDLLDCNELSPRFDEDEDDDEEERDNYLAQWDDGDHDVVAIAIDIANGNLEVGDDEAASRYRHDSIIRDSIDNGQRTQAREQCDRYGLDWNDFSE